MERTKLSNIAITHISLVKAGANKKEIIYKSSKETPLYAKQIEIKKSDDEQGVIYGIVYAPEEIDTDGEYATADEIKKCAYAFMKAQNTTNVDKDHTFQTEKAYVAESWIVKENDPTFPDEPVGSWAVAIQLEDDVLKEEVKKGDIAGISMAGTATKEVVTKSEKNSIEEFIEMFKNLFNGVSLSISGNAYNDNIKKGESEVKPEEIAKAVSDGLESALKPMQDSIQALNKKVEVLEKSDEETKEVMKKSKQDNTPIKVTKEDTIKGIL